MREEEAAGDLNYDVPAIKDVCALDLVKEAYAEMMQSEDRRADYERVLPVAQRLEY